jgi:hypothetical protein
MRKQEMRAAIKRGIRLLDENLLNWRKRIDVNELDLSECTSCVLGQIFYDYHTGLHHFNMRDIDTIEWHAFGLNLDAEEQPNKYRIEYEQLNKLWKEALS